MFTGIVKELGEITEMKKNGKNIQFKIKTKEILKGKEIGNSISINGICTTITKIENEYFFVDIMQETCEKTNVNTCKINDFINLEPALTLNQGLDGHLVQGHIDGTAGIKEIVDDEQRFQIKIKIPEEFKKHIALKGSITINGVSLTISDLRTSYFSVDLIPETLLKTNLRNLEKNDIVNIELDMISKYLEKLLEKKETETKFSFLAERGFI